MLRSTYIFIIRNIDTNKNSENNVEHIKELNLYVPNSNNFIETLSLFYVCKIWNLWELIITETPIIISSDCPSTCSSVVMLLSTLISPMKYCGDLRPYITIFDIDFKEYKDEDTLKFVNSPLMGIINPFCIKVR
jgi:hypothetical protein